MSTEKLRRARVEGFRSIRHLDLELGDLTVLIGANGSGKSNFIGFFTLMSFMLSESLQVYVGRRGGGSSILHYGPKRTPLLKAELEFAGDAGVSQYGLVMAFATPDGLLFTDEHVRFQRLGETTWFDKTLDVGGRETKLLAVSRVRTHSTARQVARIFVNRLKELQVYHFHDTSEHAYIRTLQDLDRNRDLMTNGGNLAAFLYMLRETKPRHYEHILSTVRLVVPFLRDLILEPDRLNPTRIQLRWRDDESEYEFGPHQFSDGSLRAIALVTALMQPDELLPSVILIDEPELGLHPAAMGVIADLIKEVSEKRQVVIATQSPPLLSAFSPDQVIVAERRTYENGFGESIYRRLSSDELSLWLQDFNLGELYEKNVTGGWPQ